MKLRLSLSAEQEIAAAAAWYDGQRDGLGDEFLSAVERVLPAIEAAPWRFPKVSGTHRGRHFRQGLVKRFPYRLIFEVLDTELVVLAVAHTSRHPDDWRGRSDESHESPAVSGRGALSAAPGKK